MKENEKLARLHTAWACKHLKAARMFQKECVGNLPAQELADAVEAAIQKLAADDPNWAAALLVEEQIGGFIQN